MDRLFHPKFAAMQRKVFWRNLFPVKDWLDTQQLFFAFEIGTGFIMVFSVVFALVLLR